jgi:succinoglycan biosynthesis protein ExoA
VLSLLAPLLLPWTALLLLWPAAYFSALVAFSLLLGLRHRSGYALLGVVAAFVMHTAWALGFFLGFWNHRERIWLREMAVPLRLRAATGDGS